MLKYLRIPALCLALVLASITGMTIADPERAEAASGCSVDVCISTNANQDTVTTLGSTISPYFTGYYHLHIWMAHDTVEDHNTPDQWLVGGELYAANINLLDTEIGSIHRGETVCAELWWWSQGNWHSRGLPCITH